MTTLVEDGCASVHNTTMVRKIPKLETALPPTSRRAGWYRGVKLQPPAASPKTPLVQLRDAVKHAVAKNADALAGGK
jgi:hypothetical protein